MNKKIIKRALEMVRDAEAQMRSTEFTLKKIESRLQKETVKDSVSGSSSEYPYISHTIVIEGVMDPEDNPEYKKFARELNKKQEKWLHDIRVAERTLREADPEMQDILRRYYVAGQTMEQIGAALGYTKGRISQKIKGYFDKD